MGNLLVAPITEKETHRGTTEDGLEYGLSSMQGWRVHMEDAHILEGSLHAEEVETEKESKEDGGTLKKMKIDNASAENVEPASSSAAGSSANESAEYKRIHLPRHSLFAVFDGHGGSFAAEYAGSNFVRVLSRQRAFVEYAHFVKDLAARDALENVTTGKGEGEEKSAGMSPAERAGINRKGLDLLETALKDAFLDIDREIWREVRGIGNTDSVLPSKSNNYDGADENDENNDNDEEEWQKSDAGTTANVVLFTPNWIICANAGDSRSVYSKQGNCTIPLSYDHKPDDEAEERRVYEAGGFVRGGRVEGDLAVSRGLGDFRFKQDVLYGAMGDGYVSFSQYDDARSRKGGSGPTSVKSPEDQKVSPMPDIVVQNRNGQHDEFVILACDGIFDVQTNHECIGLATEIFGQGESDLGLICEEFLDVCLEKGSKDNMTTLIVKMPAQVVGEGGGVAERRRVRMEAANEDEP